MFKSPFFKLLLKSGNGNYNLVYIILIISVIFSIITAYSAKGHSELTPLTSSGYLSTYYILLSPFIVIILFYDIVSTKVSDNTLKKILSEPIKENPLGIYALYIIVLISLIYSIALIMPGAILSYFISNTGNINSFTRYVLAFIPTFIYILFFASITFLVSSLSSKTSSSLLISFLIFAFSMFLWIPIMHVFNIGIIDPLLGISPTSSQGFFMSNRESYFIPSQDYGNSIIPLGDPLAVGFNLTNLVIFSFNGMKSSVMHSIELSIVIMLPTILYTIIILFLIRYRINNLKKFY